MSGVCPESVLKQMHIINLKTGAPSSTDNITGTTFILGYFDGVHRGHRKLIEEAKNISVSGKTTVLTFDSLPTKKGKLLSTKKEKEILLRNCGVEYAAYEDFQEIRDLSGEEFIRRLSALSPESVVCGYDFTFGRGASCSAPDFEKLTKKYGINGFVIGEYKYSDEEISSRKIKELIEEGNVEKANELLGYSYRISSSVKHGAGLGHTMGFPTANLPCPRGKVIPSTGVYFCSAKVNGYTDTFYGICDVGYRPTVEKGTGKLRIEIHFLDCSMDIYGKSVTVGFLTKMREEISFGSVDLLYEQIERDRTRAEELIKEYRCQ